jgi:hypothetical protein
VRRFATAAILAAALGSASLAPPVGAHGRAHEHGVATLQVVLDGATLQLNFETPLVNLVGFEHAPRTAAQTSAYAQAAETLRAFERLFRLPKSAGCTLGDVRLQLPYPVAGAAGASAPAATAPAATATAAAGGGDAHADALAEYTLRCAAPAQLDRIEVLVFDAFRGVREVRAERAGPRGQGAARLTPSRRALPF